MFGWLVQIFQGEFVILSVHKDWSCDGSNACNNKSVNCRAGTAAQSAQQSTEGPGQQRCQDWAEPPVGARAARPPGRSLAPRACPRAWLQQGRQVRQVWRCFNCAIELLSLHVYAAWKLVSAINGSQELSGECHLLTFHPNIGVYVPISCSGHGMQMCQVATLPHAVPHFSWLLRRHKEHTCVLVQGTPQADSLTRQPCALQTLWLIVTSV